MYKNLKAAILTWLTILTYLAILIHDNSNSNTFQLMKAIFLKRTYQKHHILYG
jgi:hypothetical protein